MPSAAKPLRDFHLHNTRGLGLANVVAGLEVGVETFDSSMAGIGGCPFAPGATGNIVTEDLVFMLESMGLHTGVDLVQLLEARKILAAAVPTEELYGYVPAAGLASRLSGSRGRSKMMTWQFSLAHLTALHCSPPQLIEIAARAGYEFVGLRPIQSVRVTSRCIHLLPTGRSFSRDQGGSRCHRRSAAGYRSRANHQGSQRRRTICLRSKPRRSWRQACAEQRVVRRSAVIRISSPSCVASPSSSAHCRSRVRDLVRHSHTERSS
jgi:hypothetical protein